MLYPRPDAYPGGSTYPSGPDSGGPSYSDAPTATFAIVATLAEAAGYADSPTATFVVTATLDESHAVGTVDAPVAHFDLVTTLDEQHEHAPTLAAAFALVSSLVESFTPGTPVVIIADGGTPLFVELTTLHYPDTPAKVLAVCQQFDGLEVAIPLGVQDVRTGKVTLSIYDDALGKVAQYLEDHGEDEPAYAICLRVRYYGLPVLWGPLTLPEWNGGPATVTLNAVGPELRLQHQYLKDGDPTSSGPLAGSGKYALSTEGLRFLRDAGINEPADNDHNVPDLGIIDGSEAAIPAELDPVPLIPYERHDEILRQMQDLGSHELGPDFEFAPVLGIPGAYAKLNCYFPQGSDRTDSVRFYYGFGPGNLADFSSTPGGKIVTRATYISSDDKVRKRATAWGSASFRGIYGQVEAADYSSNGDSVGEALTLKAKLEVRKYRTPPKFLKIVMHPEAAIDDPLRRYRYGRDFFVGDTVYLKAKKGYMRYDGDARITKVTLRQTNEGVVPDLELVPDVGDGTPETGDG